MRSASRRTVRSTLSGKDRVQVGAKPPTACSWLLAVALGQAGIDVPRRIDLHILQPFFHEPGAHEFRPFCFMESGGGNLLDGDCQVEETGG